jgi:DNA-directed RNA polymerase subunit RPC12/RpoP
VSDEIEPTYKETEVSCNYCGTKGMVRVRQPSVDHLEEWDSTFVHPADLLVGPSDPPGFVVSFSVDRAQYEGDRAEVELNTEECFCTWSCFSKRHGQRLAQFKEKREQQKKQSQLSVRLERIIRERGLQALQALYGSDLMKAMEEGKIK